MVEIQKLFFLETSVNVSVNLGVGKTAIVHSLVNNEFPHKLASTMGACFQRYECKMQDGKNISMDIWDTAGQEKYRSLLSLYYKNSDVIVMVFDVSKEETFETVSYWAKQINDNCENKPAVILVGNKIDLRGTTKIISDEKVRNYAKNKGWFFYYASAMEILNIKEIFIKAAELALNAQLKN